METCSSKRHSKRGEKLVTSGNNGNVVDSEQCAEDYANLSSDFKLNEFNTNKRFPPSKPKDRKTKRPKMMRALREKVNIPKNEEQKNTSESSDLDAIVEKNSKPVEKAEHHTSVTDFPLQQEDPKKCPACCKLISAQLYMSHKISCLRRFERETKTTARELPNSNSASCPICQLDFSDMPAKLREEHSNRCIDGFQENSSDKTTGTSKGHKTRLSVNCPFCGRKFIKLDVRNVSFSVN